MDSTKKESEFWACLLGVVSYALFEAGLFYGIHMTDSEELKRFLWATAIIVPLLSGVVLSFWALNQVEKGRWSHD